MRAQISLHRILWEAAPSSALKDRLRILKQDSDLNTPDMTAELFAIQSILKGRTKRSRKHVHA
jgi:hypothetical protein